MDIWLELPPDNILKNLMAASLYVLSSKLLMKQCVSFLSLNWCKWVTSGWKFGKHSQEIRFIKKQKESLNSFCLCLVPLANRYPDEVCFLSEPDLVSGVSSWHQKTFQAPQIYYKAQNFLFLSLFQIPSRSLLLSYNLSVVVIVYLHLCFCSYCISVRVLRSWDLTVCSLFSLC